MLGCLRTTQNNFEMPEREVSIAGPGGTWLSHAKRTVEYANGEGCFINVNKTEKRMSFEKARRLTIKEHFNYVNVNIVKEKIAFEKVCRRAGLHTLESLTRCLT